jgi:hypothetical protein
MILSQEIEVTLPWKSELTLVMHIKEAYKAIMSE